MQRMMTRLVTCALLLCGLARPASAVVWYDANGNALNGSVDYYLNGAGQATPVGPAAPLPTGALIFPSLTTPASTLTRPANTTAYAGSSTTPQLIASSATAGSVVVPPFAIASTRAAIPMITLTTNAPTGWAGVSLTVTLWTAAPTYSTGDGGTYTVATDAATQRASYTCTLVQMGNGATCQAQASVGAAPVITPAAGGLVYWDIQIAGAATPISGQTFTVIPEVWN